VVKVIGHKAASKQQTDSSIVFAMTDRYKTTAYTALAWRRAVKISKMN